ncbi:MAG: hypothetical protein K0S44_1100 [Bacteroidetes bacterium]|nr:hypothetical protein [Bacteroidota bacterium]
MLRLYMPLAFLVLFIGWILYRLLVKRDLKKNLNGVYMGLFFIEVWSVIFYLCLNN